MTGTIVNDQAVTSTTALRARALQGAVWTLGGFGFSRILRLLNHLVLAWLLTPHIFGLMTLVKVFNHGLEMFSDVGIVPSIIRSPRGHDTLFLNTAWTIQVVRGVGLWLITCILAVPYAWVYAQNDPAAWQLVYLLPVAALSAVLAGFESTAPATLNKELQLGKITMLQVTTQLITLAAIAIWALLQPTIWAMIGGGLIGCTYNLVASHYMVPGHRVWFCWDRDCAAELFKFGKWIFLSTLFTFLSLNIDKLSLGKVLSLTDLGIYAIAMVFAKLALDVSMRLGSSVMFPVYSHFQSDPDRLMTVALKARRSVLWVGGAACVCFAVIAPLFFETLWDKRYHSAGQIAQWLSVYIWARIVLHSMDRIPIALGNSRTLFVSNVVQFIGILPAALGYWLSGLSGFILGLSLGPIAAHGLLLRSLPSRQGQMLQQTVQFSFVTLLIGISASLATGWLRNSTLNMVWVASQMLLCLMTLGATFWANRELLPKRLGGIKVKVAETGAGTTQ
jgi:O-antigen/teichoic acid export membrane protein